MKDIHSHLLYGIDDGSKSIEESILLLKEMKKHGVDELILTPHYVEESNYNCNNKSKEKLYKPLPINIDRVRVYVGLNNLQNEYLTFKMADKSHMFLHVAYGPGAHVIIASDKVDEKIKRLVANIAAYYSSSSMSSTVAVNYTLVKNIKKIPGGKPGKVNHHIPKSCRSLCIVFKDFILK